MADPIAPGDAPLWYKDAVIYQLHVKSFFDSNNDGIGDFPGLLAKLDYIAELGVNAIWLLPFYPSPRRDDGYDIALYEGVSPDYGTMEDARRFIEAAHARGIRVITELVVNHTSDQHPWFQAARRAPKGSPERNFYVWADDDQGYQGTRIIFLDTEKSNWTFDPVAGQYFWHRFYSHQPDLNFDNPEVLERILSVMRFWLDLGVDGLRLDAVPYLIEREGTSNENLAETHDILRKIRAHLDANYTGRMLLAEANMWPEDTQQYFGENADECHMAFHFPLMPRMYMAIAKEDRFPITDILRQTPSIPETCQWAIFLRNHDELTLEMVTDAERDYLWSVYAADRRARLNLGIRRRLAPLLERDRRRIELMNALLFTMPGTPVIYYGDEIGMGDNIHLGDRDGVRTPMQWSPDRNGGFSKADPEQLVLPPIQDPLSGYFALNVEAQMRDPHSLLNWTRRMLAVRKAHPCFGRGGFRPLYPGNRKILAYLRTYEDETILCIANLSQTLQAVELDLTEFDGRVPVEMMGGTPFPPVGRLPYLLTVPPYGFFAFNLAANVAEPSWHTSPPEQLPEFETLVLRAGLADVLSSRNKAIIEQEALPAYVRRRRWFTAPGDETALRKADRAPIDRAFIEWAMPLPKAGDHVMVVQIVVEAGGESARYMMPLAIAWEDEQPSPLSVQLALTRVRQGRRVGYLTDGLTLDQLPRAVVRALRSGTVLELPDGGELRFVADADLANLEIPEDAPVQRIGTEQPTATIVIEEGAAFKVIRRPHLGAQPQSEMIRRLTSLGFEGTPPLLGEVVRTTCDGRSAVLALMLGYVRNQGNARNWVLDQVSRALTSSAQSGREIEPAFEEQMSGIMPFLRQTGRRLAEFHALMRTQTDDPAFAPEAFTRAEAEALGEAVAALLDSAFHALKDPAGLSAADAARAEAILQVGTDLRAVASTLAGSLSGTPKTRIHGNLNLGQVLVRGNDACLVNFGDEAGKASPWFDLASLMRALSSASAALVNAPHETVGLMTEAARTELLDRFASRAERALLGGYADGAGGLERALIDLFLLELVAQEICGSGLTPAPAVRALHGFAVRYAGAVDPELEDTPTRLEEATS